MSLLSIGETSLLSFRFALIDLRGACPALPIVRYSQQREASNRHEGASDHYTQYRENRQQPALRWQSQEGRPHKLDALRQREKLHDAWNYRDVLESYRLEDDKALQEADLSMCDDRCTLAMILMIMRGDRFCEGLLLEYLGNGPMLKWMKRLEEIDNQ